MRGGKSLLACCLLLLFGCHHQSPEPQTAKIVSSYRHVNLQTVTSLEVKGPFDVNIRPHHRRASVNLHGMPEMLAATTMTQEGSRLIIAMDPAVFSPEAMQSRVFVDLKLNQLHKINYIGTGNITAHRLESPIIDVDTNTSGTVNLSGKLGIHQLNLAGTGMVNINGLYSNDLQLNASGSHWIRLKGFADLRQCVVREKARVSLYWVEGKNMTVEARNDAYIQVAGKADQLEIKAYDSSFINAKYMRANRTFAKAFNASRVNLQTKHGQHGLAAGEGNIYYYKTPEFQSDDMVDAGSILLMDGF